MAAGFLDESTGRPYEPTAYPDHGTGIFFVGLEANGAVYGFALNHADGGFQRVATFPGGQSSVMDLSFDRATGYLWAACDNTCGNRAAVLQIDGDPAWPARGRFGLSRLFDRPSTLPRRQQRRHRHRARIRVQRWPQGVLLDRRCGHRRQLAATRCDPLRALLLIGRAGRLVETGVRFVLWYGAQEPR